MRRRVCFWAKVWRKGGFTLYQILNACPLGSKCWCHSDRLAILENGAQTIELKHVSNLMLVLARLIRDDHNIMEFGVLEQFQFTENHISHFSRCQLHHDRPGSSAHVESKALMHLLYGETGRKFLVFGRLLVGFP